MEKSSIKVSKVVSFQPLACCSVRQQWQRERTNKVNFAADFLLKLHGLDSNNSNKLHVGFTLLNFFFTVKSGQPLALLLPDLQNVSLELNYETYWLVRIDFWCIVDSSGMCWGEVEGWLLGEYFSERVTWWGNVHACVISSSYGHVKHQPAQ